MLLNLTCTHVQQRHRERHVVQRVGRGRGWRVAAGRDTVEQGTGLGEVNGDLETAHLVEVHIFILKES